MSECVVRMEMPKSCPCELAGGYDIPLPCFAGHGIPKRCKEFDECVEKGTKPDWCPIICQLPEGYGRLGDLDELERKINGARIRAMQNGQDTNPYWECGDIIASEKTIVPAESEHL